MTLSAPGSLTQNEEKIVAAPELPTPMQTLLERDPIAGATLPAEIRTVYGGDLRLPQAPDNRAYVVANFVVGMDGVASFMIPGQTGGGDVSMFNPQDQFVMGLLRASVDAVLVGANTLRTEPEHLWTSHFIFSAADSHWNTLRRALGKREPIVNAFMSASGNIPLDAAVFHAADVEAIVYTTEAGAMRIEDARSKHPEASVRAIVLRKQEVRPVDVLEHLRTKMDASHLLIEGGPRVMGDFVAAGYMDEIFLTDAPQIIGNDGSRPTWAGGNLFTPEGSPKYDLVGVKVAGGHLFRRYRVPAG
jgi:riboflavin biosynthesis pyrimidine reductase